MINMYDVSAEYINPVLMRLSHNFSTYNSNISRRGRDPTWTQFIIFTTFLSCRHSLITSYRPGMTAERTLENNSMEEKSFLTI